MTRQNDNHTPGPKWPRDHSFGISPVSVDCWKDVASSSRTLGWSSSDPNTCKALEGFKPLRSLITPSFETTISCTKGADLSKSRPGCFIFIEHIRKLTIEFLCLFKVRLSNTLSIPPFQGWSTLGVLFSDYWCTDGRLCVCLNNMLFLVRLYEEVQGGLLQSPRSSATTFPSHCDKVLFPSFPKVHISTATHQKAFVFGP